mmetsp:Transcript_28087/g.82637  ORF Transcript_28087/g.82637 Transcript_28087/m.82637 type:complete len:126 (-) Transcript_28087:980-1357(-)
MGRKKGHKLSQFNLPSNYKTPLLLLMLKIKRLRKRTLLPGNRSFVSENICVGLRQICRAAWVIAIAEASRMGYSAFAASRNNSRAPCLPFCRRVSSFANIMGQYQTHEDKQPFREGGGSRQRNLF